MCGRFRLGDQDFFPGMEIPVESNGGKVRLKWGIKGWNKLLINARVETLAMRPTFKGLLENGRYLVEASGFYEAGRYFELVGGNNFKIAALGDKSSFVIVTTAANEIVGQIHERMPLVLDEVGINLWLRTEYKNPPAIARGFEFQNKLIS